MNKAIAELLGWYDVDINYYHKPPLILGTEPTGHKTFTVDCKVPDYSNDFDTVGKEEMKQRVETFLKTIGKL